MPFQIAVKGFVDDPASVVRTSQKIIYSHKCGSFPIGMVHPTNVRLRIAVEGLGLIGGLTGDHPSSEPSRDPEIP